MEPEWSTEFLGMNDTQGIQQSTNLFPLKTRAKVPLTSGSYLTCICIMRIALLADYEYKQGM